MSDGASAISRMANPYDFANPVSREALFIGRERERKDIEYYLDHSRIADRCINLALLGERAAGKTSLLNMVEIAALERDLVPVRINLNESDVETHFAFWFKIFDAVFSRVAEVPSATGGFLFGGLHGKTYDTYLDQISSYIVPEDKTFCPFVFPIQYAKAMASLNANAMPRVSDQILMRDLRLIASETQHPIVLLIDECNILSNQRALLEMVRNTFMNLRGYMLVFTGTPDLFPLMDAVFSPIVRQFKRIEVAPFADIVETRRAVIEPLRRVGQAQLFNAPPEEFLRRLPREVRLEGDLGDLHSLTGGRPYEIQLVCHFMFRRVQREKHREMRLSFDVLEDVLRELRQSHDVDARPVISALKSLTDQELADLKFLLWSGGRIPIEHIVFAAKLADDYNSDHVRMRAALEMFCSLGILSEDRGCAIFRGDEFDRIVCKYAARQRAVHLSFEPRDVSSFFERRFYLSGVDRNHGADTRRLFSVEPRFSGGESDIGRSHLSIVSSWDKIAHGWTISDVCREIPSFAPAVYEHYVQHEEQMPIGVTLIRVDASGSGAEYSGCFWRTNEPASDLWFNLEFKGLLTTMKERAQAEDWSFCYDSKSVAGTTINDLLNAVFMGEDDDAKTACMQIESHALFKAYVDDNDRERAMLHAERLLRGREFLSADSANNLGYVLLSCGRLDDASEVLAHAVERSPELPLALYNLALVKLGQGREDEAIKAFQQLMTAGEEENFDANVGVLLVPDWSSGNLVLVEEWTEAMREDDENAVKDIVLLERVKEILGVLACRVQDS